jgi:hypothetical protein
MTNEISAVRRHADIAVSGISPFPSGDIARLLSGLETDVKPNRKDEMTKSQAYFRHAPCRVRTGRDRGVRRNRVYPRGRRPNHREAAAPADGHGRADGARDGFHAREHVRLVVRAPGALTRNATAGAGGGFTMRLAGVDPNACTGFSITATGDHGSRATLKRAPGQCAVP